MEDSLNKVDVNCDPQIQCAAKPTSGEETGVTSKIDLKSSPVAGANPREVITEPRVIVEMFNPDLYGNLQETESRFTALKERRLSDPRLDVDNTLNSEISAEHKDRRMMTVSATPAALHSLTSLQTNIVTSAVIGQNGNQVHQICSCYVCKMCCQVFLSNVSIDYVSQHLETHKQEQEHEEKGIEHLASIVSLNEGDRNNHGQVAKEGSSIDSFCAQVSDDVEDVEPLEHFECDTTVQFSDDLSKTIPLVEDLKQAQSRQKRAKHDDGTPRKRPRVDVTQDDESSVEFSHSKIGVSMSDPSDNIGLNSDKSCGEKVDVELVSASNSSVSSDKIFPSNSTVDESDDPAEDFDNEHYETPESPKISTQKKSIDAKKRPRGRPRKRRRAKIVPTNDIAIKVDSSKKKSNSTNVANESLVTKLDVSCKNNDRKSKHGIEPEESTLASNSRVGKVTEAIQSGESIHNLSLISRELDPNMKLLSLAQKPDKKTGFMIFKKSIGPWIKQKKNESINKTKVTPTPTVSQVSGKTVNNTPVTDAKSPNATDSKRMSSSKVVVVVRRTI